MSNDPHSADGCQMGEHHERVVERVALGVRAGERRRSIGVNGTEHVVVGQEMVKAEVLDRSANPPNSARISSQLDLRIDDADLHGSQSATGWTALARGRAKAGGLAIPGSGCSGVRRVPPRWTPYRDLRSSRLLLVRQPIAHGGPE
jgi:hypothetical protein